METPSSALTLLHGPAKTELPRAVLQKGTEPERLTVRGWGEVETAGSRGEGAETVGTWESRAEAVGS